ncbi:MAG TPA: DUF3619 family protein [Gammaproteobacteria bacterium]|nr:DUF3619 family protein [Gammaproteobacteria bacterium]
MKEPQLPDSEQQLNVRIRAVFDEAADDLDPAIAGRLRAARRTALESAGRNVAGKGMPHFGPRQRWMLGGAMAASVTLAVLVAAPWRDAVRGPTDTDVAPLASLDLELVSEEGTLELLEELEFYQWLLESEQDAG